MNTLHKWQAVALLVLATLFTAPLRAADTVEPWMKPDPAALKRWQDMRFGMFIHWGPVSLTAQEIGWSRGDQTPIEKYDNLYKNFNPTKFNADEWASIAKAAGMKYMVLTTKHHDGFCLWDTKLTDYNIMHTPFRRDVVKELAAACRKQGIGFGTYYSVTDWYDTNWPTASPHGSVKRKKYDLDAYAKYLQGQLAELIKNYGPLLTIWNDTGELGFAGYGKRGADTIRLVRRLQPDILINDRTGDGGDYGTPEQSIGGFNMKRPWESCMTISRSGQWAWGGEKDGVKALAPCLLMLIRAAGGDGNVLLNVGPRPDGLIDPEQANRLKEMGDWLQKYGESIYATRGGPYKPSKMGVSTRRDNKIFLHILDWPADTLRLPALAAKIVKSSVLTGGAVTVNQTDAGIEISVPTADRKELDTIVVLELDKPAIEIEPIGMAAIASLTSGKKANASNVYQNDPAYGAAKAIDGDEETRWATDASTGPCWLEVDLGQPQTFDRAAIQVGEGYGVRVKAFELQFKDNNAWKTFYTGKTVDKHLEVKFEPVTARLVRLTISDYKDSPTIHEFQLFAPAPKK